MPLERCQGKQQLTVPTRGALAARGASGGLKPSKTYKSKGDLPKRFPPGVGGKSGWKWMKCKARQR